MSDKELIAFFDGMSHEQAMIYFRQNGKTQYRNALWSRYVLIKLQHKTINEMLEENGIKKIE